MLLTHEFCYICNKNMDHFNGKCGYCETKREIEEFKKYKEGKEKMTTKERLRVIEAWIYNHDNLDM